MKWYWNSLKKFYSKGPEGKIFRQGYMFGYITALLNFAIRWLQKPENRQRLKTDWKFLSIVVAQQYEEFTAKFRVAQAARKEER